jgi:regulation of enolase protein 1 (concanavalin A-like superfamily)
MKILSYTAPAATKHRGTRILRAVSIMPLLVVTLLSAAANGENVDIGNPSTPGSTVQSGDEWTISSGGTDIWGTSDQFRFSHQSISGSGSVTVKVESVGNSDPWAKAGVMVRADTAVGAANAAVFATPGNGVAFQWRSAPGGTTTSAKVPGAVAPIWLKLERHENDFSAFYSDDGKKWNQVGSTQTVMMKKTALVGLALTAHTSSTTCTAKFRGFFVKR